MDRYAAAEHWLLEVPEDPVPTYEEARIASRREARRAMIEDYIRSTREMETSYKHSRGTPIDPGNWISAFVKAAAHVQWRWEKLGRKRSNSDASDTSPDDPPPPFVSNV